MSKKSKIDEIVGKRYNDNISIMNILAEYLQKHPEIRFSQAINDTGIIETDDCIDFWVNDYYTEPEVILERIKK